jgi:hypothetical protein
VGTIRRRGRQTPRQARAGPPSDATVDVPPETIERKHEVVRFPRNQSKVFFAATSRSIFGAHRSQGSRMNNSRFVVKLVINSHSAAPPAQLFQFSSIARDGGVLLEALAAELLAFGTMGKIGILKSSVAFPT